MKINDKVKYFMEENKKWYNEVDLYQATSNYVRYLSDIPIRTIEDYKREKFGDDLR